MTLPSDPPPAPRQRILKIPPVVDGNPGPGKRVRYPLPGQQGDLHSTVYLPPEWRAGRRYPVLFEFTGNFFPRSGSTGRVDGAALGYGFAAGQGFLWVVLPFVETGGATEAVTWWGDEEATVAYAKAMVERICTDVGGDRRNLFLCGFSRGAIAVNYIGLHDDAIASLWRGLISHDHYDGQKAWGTLPWGSPLASYRQKAGERLARLKGTKILIMQNESTKHIAEYLGDRIKIADFTFLDVPIAALYPFIPDDFIVHAHTDRWMYLEGKEREAARGWLISHLAPH